MSDRKSVLKHSFLPVAFAVIITNLSWAFLVERPVIVKHHVMPNREQYQLGRCHAAQDWALEKTGVECKKPPTN